MELETKPFNLIDDLHRKFFQEIAEKKEALFLKGLARKGYEFSNRIEIENFVKTRCFCATNLQTNTKTYYVDNMPFLVYREKNSYNQTISKDDRSICITADLGEYQLI